MHGDEYWLDVGSKTVKALVIVPWTTDNPMGRINYEKSWTVFFYFSKAYLTINRPKYYPSQSRSHDLYEDDDSMIDAFILWAVHRCRSEEHRFRIREVVNFDNEHQFTRFEFLWKDEIVDRSGKHHYRSPWWRPFHVMLHWWNPLPEAEEFHDHPRWTVTICLKGKMIEHSPWSSRTLRPGSIVFRSRKAIHAIEIPREYSGKTWTLFITGRRDHKQSTYKIAPAIL